MDHATLEHDLYGKSFLDPIQTRELDREIQQQEWAINGQSMYDGEKVAISVKGYEPEPELAAEHLARLRTMRASGTPPDLKPHEQNYLYKRVKELEDEIRHTMPTQDMMERPTPGNVDSHMAWEQHNLQNILLWRTMRRTLDPLNDEAHFTSVEILRTNTPPKGDPRKFWRGYDNISFHTEQEKRQVEVDDPMYLAFLKLYAKRWNPKNIQRELGMSPVQYEVAVSRLNGDVTDPEVGQGNADAIDTDEFWLLKEMRELKVSKARLIRDAQISQRTLNQWISQGEVEPKYRKTIERVMSKFRAKSDQEKVDEPEIDTTDVSEHAATSMPA